MALGNIENSTAEKASSSIIWPSVFSRRTKTVSKRSLAESMIAPFLGHDPILVPDFNMFLTNYIRVSLWKDDRSRCWRKQRRSMSKSRFPWLIFTSARFHDASGHDLRARDREFVTILRNAVLWLGHQEVPAAPAEGRLTLQTDHRREILSRGPRGSWTPAFVRLNEDSSKERNSLVYADCGREWGQDRSFRRKQSPSKGDAYLFLVVRRVRIGTCFRLMSCPETRLVFKSKAFAPEEVQTVHQLVDFDNGRRIQSIRLQSKDGSQSYPALGTNGAYLRIMRRMNSGRRIPLISLGSWSRRELRLPHRTGAGPECGDFRGMARRSSGLSQ